MTTNDEQTPSTNNSGFVLKHGDTKQTFETGAQRDTADAKPRLDLLSPVFLDRMGHLAREGGKHYGDRNWEKGMPLSRLLGSAFHHLIQTLDGQEDEDHPIQCAFNMMMYVHTLHKIRTGSLPIKLDDVCREQNLDKKNLEDALTPDQKTPKLLPTAACCGTLWAMNTYGAMVSCPNCGKKLCYA